MNETHSLELWASQEVREALGWSTRRHLQLARESGGFPEPVAVVAGGTIAVWLASDVRKWAAEQPPSRSWRREEAVRLYRRGFIQAEICRQLKAKPDSVRKWLKDAGETLPSERRSDA